MSFKVKCKKHEDGDGSYVLSYGKGKKKITGRLYRNDDDLTWFIRVSLNTSWDLLRTDFHKKRDAIAAWSVWVTEEYQKAPISAATVTAPTTTSPPRISKKRKGGAGPPAFKRSSAPASAPNRPTHPDYQAERTDVIDDNENPYHANPLNDNFFALGANFDSQILLPVGALDEVFNWMQKNLPFTATLEYPWVRVAKVLQREFPDEVKYQSTGV